MSPILESIGSVKGFGWGAFSLPSSFESIATVNGTGSSGTITFSSIPSTYKHLQIRFLAFSSTAGWTMTMTANGASGTSYARHLLYGNGSSVSTSSAANAAEITISQQVEGVRTSEGTAGIVDILDYASTTKNKTIRTLSGMDRNGNGEIDLSSGLYNSTTAISSLSFIIGGNFTSNAQFALYGIKGA